MAKITVKKSACGSSAKEAECCRVESVVTVDERGQMVLPKELRKSAGIRAGDKLAVMSLKKGNEFCCFLMVKIDELTEIVKERIGPMLKGTI